jgi:hypothetical protein
MTGKKCVFIFLLFIGLLSSCKKEHTTIVIMDACMEADKTIISRRDSVTFTNCTVGDEEASLIITRDTVLNKGYSWYAFTNDKYTHVFNDTGLFQAFLSVSMRSKSSTLDTTIIKIRVNP